MELGQNNMLGSYSDFFIPTLKAARAAGASEAEVVARVRRAHTLAKQGKYYSTAIEFAAKDGDLESLFAADTKYVSDPQY